MMRAVAAALALLLAGCAGGPPPGTTVGPVGTPAGQWREQVHWIPLKQADGTTVLIEGRTCRPATDAPARVVLIAHGSPPLASARPGMRLTECSHEAVQWFTSRGYLVVLSLRRGYGATGGAYQESATECSIDAYARSARTSAQDLTATLEYASGLPYARRDGAVVVGQSAGGWAAVGLDSQPHPGVVAIVSMAGGRGGHVGDRPNANCHPENLAGAAGELGRTSTTPMLWVYTANDSYFAPRIAEAMYRAFSAAGGKAEFRQPAAFANDGHTLFFGRGGSLVWGPLIEHYLAERGAT